MNQNLAYNPILSQLKVLKNKLDQKGKIIAILNECIKTQQHALLSIVSQFQAHESKIMRRLHRLEQINIRYIKNYLEVRQQNKIEEYVPIEHMFVVDPKLYIKQKIDSIKQCNSDDRKSGSTSLESKKMVENCLQLMKSYLHDRKIHYDRVVTGLTQERKRKMKESIGLEGYRKNKDQAKFIQSLKSKIERFSKKSTSIDPISTVQIFHSREQIQKDISRLDPSKGQITLQESLAQQQMFKQIVHEIITSNTAERQEACFLEGSYSFLKKKLQSLSEVYGVEFINQSIHSIKNISAESKANIINNRYESNNYLIGRKQGNQFDRNPQNTSIYMDSQIHLQGENQRDGNNYDQNGNPYRRKTENGEYILNQSHQNNQDNSQQALDIVTSKTLRNKESKSSSKLNNRFQKTVTKTFFQEQERSRDQLISKQQSEIVQHEKVIDKLITFIKKQFKDRSMDDIDGDDPEQLIGYYFKVNEKKYVDIREEMQELQKETAKTVNNLTFQNEQLNIKVNELKEEMDQLLEKYQKSTFEFHILISRTEDLVKISLETLISTCMNNITPQTLIQELEKIIYLIKENMEAKRDIIYKFTVKQEFIEERQPKINEKDFISEIKLNNEAFIDFIADVKFLQIETKRQSDQLQLLNNSKIEQKVEEKMQESKHSQIQEEFNVTQQLKHSQEIDCMPIQSNLEKSLQKPQNKSEGIDENFLKNIKEQIELIKDRNLNQVDEMYDINEMYTKYKQAIDCLERAENLNRENEIKYQHFITGLKRKGAWECPEKLEEKLFYMEKLVTQQNELLTNQRIEYEQTILKQVNESQILAQNILKKFKLKRRETKA